MVTEISTRRWRHVVLAVGAILSSISTSCKLQNAKTVPSLRFPLQGVLHDFRMHGISLEQAMNFRLLSVQLPALPLNNLRSSGATLFTRHSYIHLLAAVPSAVQSHSNKKTMGVYGHSATYIQQICLASLQGHMFGIHHILVYTNKALFTPVLLFFLSYLL